MIETSTQHRTLPVWDFRRLQKESPLFRAGRKSSKFLPIGTCLSPQSDGYVQWQENRAFELIMEARRPQGMLSRFKSVFLSANIDDIDGAGGYVDAVYAVEPAGDPQRSDLAWYSDAWCFYGDGETLSENEEIILNSMIDAYWSGEQYRIRSRSNFEFRVKSARVVEMAELNVDLDDLETISAEGPPEKRCAQTERPGL